MNILIFGPNGSGKGTHGEILRKMFNVRHIESGVMFREHISGGTDIGTRAKEYINRGELVPDDITIPMIMNCIKTPNFKNGWLLDGFPRNLTQAEALCRTMNKEGMNLDIVIRIILDGNIAKRRIMGRRLCTRDNRHSNNISIDLDKPAEDDGRAVCHVCGCEQHTVRADDQDEEAIDKRLNIYFDTKKGTLAAVNYFKKRVKVLEVCNLSGVKETSENMIRVLSCS